MSAFKSLLAINLLDILAKGSDDAVQWGDATHFVISTVMSSP